MTGSDRIARSWLAAGLFAGLVGILAALFRPPQADVAWPLYLADEVLRGARLGRDFVEVNPPLFVWLAIPPVLLGKLTGLSSWAWAVLLSGVLVGVATGLTARALRPAGMSSPALGAAVAGTLFALAVLPGWEFLQREHLALVLTLPWLAVSAARLAGGHPDRSGARSAGILGALGLAFKPHFVIPWVLVEAVVIRRGGIRALLRPETAMIPLVGAGYLLLVLWLAPDYLPSVLPLREAYQRYLHNIPLYNIGPTPWVLVPALGIAGYVAQWLQGQRPTPLQDLLLAAVVGFWVAAIAQGKGLPYHYLAAIGYGFLLLGTVALAIPSPAPWGGPPSRQILRGARAVAGLGPLIMTVWLLGTLVGRVRPPYLADGYEELVQALQADAREDVLVVMSSNLTSGWPLTATVGARWGLRYVSLWMLGAYYYDELWRRPGIVAHRPLSERIGSEREFGQAVVSDLVASRPRYLIVLLPDPTVLHWGGATRFDYLGYFGSDPAFAALLNAYDDLGVVSRYRIFRRK